MLLLRGRITERVGALFDRNVTLGFKLDNLDAPWEYSEEPHVKRRQVRAGRLTKMKMFFLISYSRQWLDWYIQYTTR